jgi:inner membrane protein
MLAGYAWVMLGEGRRAALVAGWIAGLYGYLYTLLMAEDYALLFGALGLFVILALAMFFTRRVDWYAPSAAAQATAPRNGQNGWLND